MTERGDSDVILGGGAARRRLMVQEFQEHTHGPSWDYRAGSPHLAHWQLYDRLVGEVLFALRGAGDQGLPPTVLEIGAGHGGYTEPVLAAGGRVTATEMSRPSLARLEGRFGGNESFSCSFDPDGSLEVLDDRRFSLVLCVSVLHHIPDYKTFVKRAVSRHLAAGGTFISIQDPLWYPSVSRTARRLDRLAYLSWRVTRGQYLDGLRTQLRRIRGIYDETKAGDMVEYHVVRNGVDQEALRTMLEGAFEDVRLEKYWSTPAAILQRSGTRLRLRNTFMLVARGNLGHGHTATDDSSEISE
ncbi:MAG TPA: class I SAM-dependent methyltransferase [Chloroflexota bacterium]|nr:class I SAM-dependent methyltransferase [Chloroflexota bacterium]